MGGAGYERTGGEARAGRHGTNPGSVRLAGQRRVGIPVPRVRGPDGGGPLQGYRALHSGGELDEGLFKRVLYGISCRDYAVAAEALPGAVELERLAGVHPHQ